ncbi:MAG: hypothetical protein CTY12_04645 [Methylotenera sp.]|nr:MAG: hypothetical protein CTY12_04645 [Methylotenera sp.]
MSGLRIEGNISGNIAEVDAAGDLFVTGPIDSDNAGYFMLAGELGSVDDPTGRLTQPLRTSTQGRMTVGQPVLLLNEIFHNTAVNSAVFTTPTTTMTITAAAGTLNLNASAITTLNTVARVSTYAYYPLQADFATYATWEMLLTRLPQTNNTVEAGLLVCTASTLPTDGAFFRYDSTGSLKAVLNNNGTEFTSAILPTPSVGIMHKYKIIIENDRVLYYIDGALQAVLSPPNNLSMPCYTSALPFTIRIINGPSAPTLAQVVRVGYTYVGLQDAAGMGKSSQHLAAIQGRMSSQGQTGHTMGSTALYTNSQAPGAGVAMTNTAAGPATGLGGQAAVLPTLAANTDGILFTYLNPIATSAIPGKTLYITGIKLQGIVTTLLVGGPVLYFYSLAYGHTAISLATTESATAKAPRRIPLGIETYAATAAVGTLGSQAGVYMAFHSPIAINPGEYVQIVAKNVDTVTTAGVITVLAAVDGFWE